jgi:hypothetical protein
MEVASPAPPAGGAPPAKPFYMTWPPPSVWEQRVYLWIAPLLLTPLLAGDRIALAERIGWAVSFGCTVVHWSRYVPGSVAQMVDMAYHFGFFLLFIAPLTPAYLVWAIAALAVCDLAAPQLDQHNGVVLHVWLRLLVTASVFLRDAPFVSGARV